MKYLYLFNSVLLFGLAFLIGILLIDSLYLLRINNSIMLFYTLILLSGCVYITFIATRFFKICRENKLRNRKTDISLFISFFGLSVLIGVLICIVFMCGYLQGNSNCGGFDGVFLLIFGGIPYLLSQIISSVLILKGGK